MLCSIMDLLDQSLTGRKKLNIEKIIKRVENPMNIPIPFSFKIYMKSKKATQNMYKLLGESKDTLE